MTSRGAADGGRVKAARTARCARACQPMGRLRRRGARQYAVQRARDAAKQHAVDKITVRYACTTRRVRVHAHLWREKVEGAFKARTHARKDDARVALEALGATVDHRDDGRKVRRERTVRTRLVRDERADHRIDPPARCGRRAPAVRAERAERQRASAAARVEPRTGAPEDARARASHVRPPRRIGRPPALFAARRSQLSRPRAWRARTFDRIEAKDDDLKLAVEGGIHVLDLAEVGGDLDTLHTPHHELSGHLRAPRPRRVGSACARRRHARARRG